MPAALLPGSAPADLFLSYNHRDGASVERIRQALEHRGVRTFLDHRQLRPGAAWPQALESALSQSRAVAVFLGPHGLGGWQRREMFFALDMQVAAERRGAFFPVVPVLLAGADPAPSFLLLNTWVDVANDVDLATDALVSALSSSPDNRARPPLDPATLRPYVGLRAFREEEGAFFFGRDAFVARLLERIEDDRFLSVIGASGSGKSSVVYAGLVPRLRQRRPPRLTWEVAAMTPGRYPWRRLADALVPLIEPLTGEIELATRAGELEKALATGAAAVVSVVERALKASGGADRLLLVVDQFEELFTLTAGPERASFIEALTDAVHGSALSVVVTLRADFYGRALQSSRSLSDALGRAAVPLGPMVESELRDVIQGPARRVGATFQPGLVDRVVYDVLREPGHLPLLEYALTDLWTQCAAATEPGSPVILTLDAYHRAGELSGAIATRAESLFATLSAGERTATRSLFGRLVRVARGGEEGADTRRRARRSELDTDAWAVAQRFAAMQYRLLVVSSGAAPEDRNRRGGARGDHRALGAAAGLGGGRPFLPNRGAAGGGQGGRVGGGGARGLISARTAPPGCRKCLGGRRVEHASNSRAGIPGAQLHPRRRGSCGVDGTLRVERRPIDARG